MQNIAIIAKKATKSEAEIEEALEPGGGVPAFCHLVATSERTALEVVAAET